MFLQELSYFAAALLLGHPPWLRQYARAWASHATGIFRKMPNTSNEIARTETRYQAWMFAICILFGVVLILNTTSANEGVWYWYAVLLNGGKRLYTDLHLPLQPFFVLESAGFLKLLGNGWLVSKIPALAHLLVYALSLLLVIRYSDWPDLQKAVVLGCAFLGSITSRLERFDDYHLIADSFQIYSVVLLLVLHKSTSLRRNLLIVAALGVLSGLSITTRANDGAALLLAIAIAISCLALFKRLVSLVLFVVVAALTVIYIVHLTGDSLSIYATSTMFRAAGLKGGVGGCLGFSASVAVVFAAILAVLAGCWQSSSAALELCWPGTLILLPSIRGGWRRNVKRASLGFILTSLASLHPSSVEIKNCTLHGGGAGRRLCALQLRHLRLRSGFSVGRWHPTATQWNPLRDTAADSPGTVNVEFDVIRRSASGKLWTRSRPDATGDDCLTNTDLSRDERGRFSWQLRCC